MRKRQAVLALAALLLPAAAFPQADEEKLRAAKALFVDRQYAEARAAWEAIRASGREGAPSAPFWIARCSESLGETERALAEYGQYLEARPSDRTLAEEAKTSRIALAVKLFRAGKPHHVGLAREALSDPNRTVRYFAALQMASLGPETGKAAVPVLKEILEKEKDEDLVERAKLALWRLDRSALERSEASPPLRGGGAREATWIRVRIYEKGASRASVAINVPLALATLAFKALPDEARAELRKEGYDSDRFLERLKKTGPTEILTIEGDEGERIQVWIE